jgi:hypothetical protein
MMIAKIGRAATAEVMKRIGGSTGMESSLAALRQDDPSIASQVQAAQLRAQNVAADLAERSEGTKYPAVQVYCEKIANTLAEKFRTFSGTVRMAVEVRHSRDRLDGLQDQLEIYADAVTQVLHGSRGDWGDGMFYGGAYDVSFSAVKHGGRNFIQTAKITFEIGVSKS